MTEPRPGDAFQPGDVLNNTYRIEALLGRGGTSDVYRARSEISGRLVAVKVLKSEFLGNDDYLVLMTREEEIREVRHDAIVRYSENHRTSEGLVYLLMDYIDGPGLDQKLKEGPMSAEDLLVLCKRVGEGLEEAHNRSIVHRDLSPDNILLRDNDPAQAVVIDFGIAKDTNPGAETIVGNEFAGKYAYAAPEQLSGKTDARSDIYSLGALMLANFRGKSPDVGANPMEVVQKKNDPLDTSGVPEPLKSLLDRMTAPKPEDRFQSMGEVLAYLAQGPSAVAALASADDALSDATVVVPMSKSKPDDGLDDLLPDPAPAPAAPPPAKKEPKKVELAKAEKSSGGSGGLIAAGLAVVLIGGGAGAYFGGFIGGGEPPLPPVSPFSLVIAQPENNVPTASGYVPNADMQTALNTRMTEMGGTADLTLASGNIAATWGQDVMTVLADAVALDDWQLAINDNTVELSGATSNQAVLDAITARYSAGWPGGLNGTIDVAFTSLFLDPGVIDDLLTANADCGPLTQIDRPGTVGYGPDDDILIQGTLASEENRASLQQLLEAEAEGRNVVLDTEVLNPSLCLVENYLPEVPKGGIDVVFRDGASGPEMPAADYVVGQNPVIDVIIPEDMFTGYLSVSIVDVSGDVFHMLPNIGRPDNSVLTLRDFKDGKVPLRIAYGKDEDKPEGALAIEVDDSALGKSKILVIASEAPLFRQMRPTVESAVGFAEALSERAATGEGLIRSLDAEIITTALP